MEISINITRAKELGFSLVDAAVAKYLVTSALVNEHIPADDELHAEELSITKNQFSKAKNNLLAFSYINVSRSQGITVKHKLVRALLSEYQVEQVEETSDSLPVRVIASLSAMRVEKLLAKRIVKPSQGHLKSFLKIHRSVKSRIKGMTDDEYYQWYNAYFNFMFSKWYTNENMRQYLRVSTLFGSVDKFWDRIHEMSSK